MANFSSPYLTCNVLSGITTSMREKEPDLFEAYIADVIDAFGGYKKLAERAMSQVSDEEFFRGRGGDSNSIAILVKHISGNQKSRWTNFLTEDGEKEDRDRDSEFEVYGESRADLSGAWDQGWQTLFDALGSLTADDLAKTVLIRGEEHIVFQAISRQLTHYAYHIGQIVLMAKEMKGPDWQTLSVPKNRSKEFNSYIAERIEGGVSKTNPLEGTEGFAERLGDGK
jgi:uncharacterized damage-inducible protein DinB